MKHIHLALLLATLTGSCFGAEQQITTSSPKEEDCLRFVSNVPVYITITSSTDPQDPFFMHLEKNEVAIVQPLTLKDIIMIKATKRSDLSDSVEGWQDQVPAPQFEIKIDPPLTDRFPQVCIINYNKIISRLHSSSENNNKVVTYNNKFDIVIHKIDNEA